MFTLSTNIDGVSCKLIKGFGTLLMNTRISANRVRWHRSQKVQKFRLFALNIPDKGLHTDELTLLYQYNKNSHDNFY